MAQVKDYDEKKVAKEFIEEAEDEDIGFLNSYFRMLQKITLVNLVKGFFSGIGGFIGSIFCYYYLLPRLGLQEYSKFYQTLKNIK
eukprot:CAMPEP_0168325884 /NCGR_PEP_ID=MMETSP0213-20121227/4958_1 /TAXON_ID=151035 /ORGANISM="Euplotes harpa, Strain FSP1.4" /LENGTH=84 /DNA_ID=CAMNT_0008328463 /DNA_START=24 /DNA_END=278 /DNA_ORIENTATION=+